MGRALNLHGANRTVYTNGRRVITKPLRGSLDVDLTDYPLHPGMINAHDHLELNHYPRTKFREVYANAHQWGEDVNQRLDTSPYRELRSYPISNRCLIGGVKNLLSGVTTVAQHGTLHKTLTRPDFPVRVLQTYGWSHSLHFDTDAAIQASYRATPPDVSWFIHLAEGTDKIAAGEYQRLKALGCVGSNTVIVHGVGMTPADIADAAPQVRGLVWCPTTNHYLLGETAAIKQWGSKIALGSDSRLTADGDLYHEMRAAVATGRCDVGCLTEAVGKRAAHILGLDDVGHLNPGAHADVISGFYRERKDIALVMLGGVPQIGDPDVMLKFPHIKTVRVTLDENEKLMSAYRVRQLQRCSLNVRGLIFLESIQRRFWLF